MVDAAENVAQFVAGRQRADIDADRMLGFAVLRAIEIIGEHSGHVLFPLFRALLGAKGTPSSPTTPPDREIEIEEVRVLGPEHAEPRLATPDLASVLRRAGVEPIADAKLRQAVLAAMREAAEKRIAGVIEEKRRRFPALRAELDRQWRSS